jgi:acetyl esterase/lipase
MASPQAVELREGLLAWRASIVGQGPISIEGMRAGASAMATFATEPIGVEVTEVDVDGIPGLLHTPTDLAPAGIALWIHGGGLTMGSAWTHSRMSGHFAVASGCAFLNTDFRLAPENPFPAANEDAMTAYRWLVRQGYEPASIAIGGDSAGAGPALSTLVALRDAGEPRPAGGIIISGWLDFTMSSPAFTERVERDLVNTPSVMAQLRDGVLDGHNPADPAASPLFADFARLPPLYVLASEEEVLYDDNAELAKKAGAAGVDVTFEGKPDIPHVPTLWAGNLPEADDAVRAIGSWLRQTIDQAKGA